MELRPYQEEAKTAIFTQWESGNARTLLVLPTGCGKTIVFAKVTEECVNGGITYWSVAETVEFVNTCCSGESIVYIYKQAQRSQLLLACCLGCYDV